MQSIEVSFLLIQFSSDEVPLHRKTIIKIRPQLWSELPPRSLDIRNQLSSVQHILHRSSATPQATLLRPPRLVAEAVLNSTPATAPPSSRLGGTIENPYSQSSSFRIVSLPRHRLMRASTSNSLSALDSGDPLQSDSSRPRCSRNVSPGWNLTLR